MSTSPEIVLLSETISQTAQEGLGGGDQVIAKSEMPGIGHSGETRQPGEEGLRLGQDVRLSMTPEVGQYPVETSQRVVSGSTSEMSLGAAFDCDPTSEQMGGVQSKGQSSDAATQNPNGLGEMLTAGRKLQSVSGNLSVNVQLFEAPKNSQWFDAIEKKDCKLLLKLYKSDRKLWVQTGLKGRSVLHVAIMQGCMELVHLLVSHDIPSASYCRTAFDFLWKNAKDGRLKDASAQDIRLVMDGLPVEIGNELSEDLSAHWLRFFDRPSEYEDGRPVLFRHYDYEMSMVYEVISDIASKMNFVMDENDVDFNFESPSRKKQLYVHMACNMLRNLSMEGWRSCAICQFILAIINDLSEKNLLEKLFEQKDGQGRTILHILVNLPFTGDTSSFFLDILAPLPEACVNAVDKAGRTALHWAVGHNNWKPVLCLLICGKAKPDVSFRTQYYWNMTILNLILLYEIDLTIYKMLFDSSDVTKYKSILHFMVAGQLNKEFGKCCIETLPTQPILDTLSYAVLLGKEDFVKSIMETEEYEKEYLHKNQLLSYASYSGDVKILQFLLQKVNVENLNIFLKPFKAPPLHLAVVQTQTTSLWPEFQKRKFNEYLHCNDFISIELLERKLREKKIEEDKAIANTNNINTNEYSARQACITLLLQAGANILATDKDGHMADPGKWALNEARTWWYELVATQTANIKKDLHAAGNGTAIVATLVATASFVGPLTPPLNYVAMASGTTTTDVSVQVTKLLIKVFVVSNSLSFYLAITSIMLAIMPSLPIPKEGLVSGSCDDLKRSRRTISIAIGMLLASIISVLISFAASSFIVIPLQQRGLMAYSTSIGGIICCMGIISFFLRFLRLICPQNTVIRKLYQKYGKL